jgi:hypothetical protein
MWNQIMKLSYAGAFNPPLFIYRGPPPRTSVGTRWVVKHPPLFIWGPAGGKINRASAGGGGSIPHVESHYRQFIDLLGLLGHPGSPGSPLLIGLKGFRNHIYKVLSSLLLSDS